MTIQINTRPEKKYQPCRETHQAATAANGSRRGLWGMVAFLAISLCALVVRDAQLIAALPDTVQAILGDTPPPMLVHLALAASTVSAMILILGRMTGHTRQGYSWVNIAMPAFFYPLYLIAETDRGSFIAVMAVGLTLLVLEHITVRHCKAKETEGETLKTGKKQ